MIKDPVALQSKINEIRDKFQEYLKNVDYVPKIINFSESEYVAFNFGLYLSGLTIEKIFDVEIHELVEELTEENKKGGEN